MTTDFKLQRSESYALTTCGCELEHLKFELRLTYCPLHAAAPALLKALEDMLREAEAICRIERERTKDHGWYPALEDHVIPRARAAIKSARGEPTSS